MSSLAARRERLIVHGAEPYNAEPPLERLRAAFLTPAEAFYVRCHGNLPEIDAAAYRLTVEGRGGAPRSLSLDEIRAHCPAVTRAATLQCAGNRRSELRAVAPVSGDPWGPGAIGTAEWTGARLADVLALAGGAPEGVGHVAFESHDLVHGADHPYGVSIPLSKAMSPETLLAWAMNGAPLLPEHGFPLRAVVPGYAGVRSAKWLRRIAVQDHPSDNPIQAGDYKLYPPDVTPETAEPARGHTIDLMPLTSAICEPARFAALRPGPARIRGYAVCGDRAVVRVDVSGDGGRTWAQAQLEPSAPLAWTLWSILLDLPDGAHELAVRAWDAAGQTQAATPDEIWNHKGYLGTAWHRVPVRVEA
jgi:sulfite oxidase